MNIPMILKQNDNHSMTYDLYSLLLTYRIIFLSGEINDTLANTIIAEGEKRADIPVFVKFTKRGLSGVPTFMDWDGCVGSVKVLLQK